MNRAFFALAVLFVLVLLSLPAHAQGLPGGTLCGADISGQDCIDNFNPDYNTGGYYPAATKQEVCKPVNSFDSCRAACDCRYRNNKNKCNKGVFCIQMAAEERNACYGNCIADWS